MVDLSRTEYPCSAVLLMWVSIRSVYRLHWFFTAQLIKVRCGLAMQRASSISADRLYRVVELARLDTRRRRVSHGSCSC